MNLILPLLLVAIVTNIFGVNAERDDKKIIHNIKKSKCYIHKEKNEVLCYKKFTWLNVRKKIIVRLKYDDENLKSLGLLFDGNLVLEKPFSLYRECAPMPGKMKDINICLQAYFAHVDRRPPSLSFDTCFIVIIADSIFLKLSCIRVDKDKHLTQNKAYRPEDQGVNVLTLKEGNLKYKLKNKIPDQVMNEIVNEWKMKETHSKNMENESIKTPRNLISFNTRAKNSFTQFGKDTEHAFKQFGKDVEKEWDKAGEKLKQFGEDVKDTASKFGNTITGWFG